MSSISDSGQHVIQYDDGDLETLDLWSEAWRFCATSVSSIPAARFLASDEPEVLAYMLTHFGNKPFMLHQAQVFPPYATANAYDEEDRAFKLTIRIFPIPDIPARANVSSIHTVFKVKIEGHHSLRLKARIAPHGNEDAVTAYLRSHCSMCSLAHLDVHHSKQFFSAQVASV